MIKGVAATEDSLVLRFHIKCLLANALERMSHKGVDRNTYSAESFISFFSARYRITSTQNKPPEKEKQTIPFALKFFLFF